jgi:hypothetical protein
MSAKVDLYNNAYGNYAAEVYREIRVETYGQDLGQTSWVTSDESAEIMRLLEPPVTPTFSKSAAAQAATQFTLRRKQAAGCLAST